MLPPELGRIAFQIATWIVLVAAVMLLFLEKGSAERVITQFSLVLGLLLGAAVWLLTKGSRDRSDDGRK